MQKLFFSANKHVGMCAVFTGMYVKKYTQIGQDAYAAGGAIVEQAISGIRTISTFSLQKRFLERYKIELNKAFLVGRKKGIVFGLGFGSFLFILFSTYGLAFWYGYTLVVNHVDGMDGADVMVDFMAMMMGEDSVCFSSSFISIRC